MERENFNNKKENCNCKKCSKINHIYLDNKMIDEKKFYCNEENINNNIKQSNKNNSILTDDCKNELKKINCKVLKFDEPMSKHTSFKIGGNADVFISIENIDDLKKVIDIAKTYNLPITIVGNGTNILVKDNGIRGIVINFADSSFKIFNNTEKEENIFNSKFPVEENNNKASKNEDNTINKEQAISNDKIAVEKNENSNINKEIKIEVSAGMKNGVLAQELLKNEISGFEFASGIPGTIGGAIYMNAGAFGSEMSNIVENVTYIDLNDFSIHTIENEDCKFAYRTSIFEEEDEQKNLDENIEKNKEEILNEELEKNKIKDAKSISLEKVNQDENKKNKLYNKKLIIKAVLKFSKGNKEEISKKIQEYKEKRLNTQPLDLPNAGSTFKRKDNYITAKLIDECNLKGYKIGGAEVSTKHAGFIVNSGNATADDVIKLMKYVEEEVYQKFEVRIEKELRIIGQ